MRLGTALVAGEETVVIGVGDRALPLRTLLDGDSQLESVRELIEDWPAWGSRVTEATADARALDIEALEIESLEWLPPVKPSKLICVGANYRDHIVEMEASGGPAASDEPFPFGFLKPPSTALVGSGSDVRIPSYATKLDWEAELAVVIGDPELASGDAPLDAIFGYSPLNDLSVRDFLPFPHALGIDAIVSKGFDGSCPMGPWITLADAAPDPQCLDIELRVNGATRQRSSTAQMIRTVAEIVAHFGRVLTLEPGDVISTGTPAGVGAGQQPPQFLSAGDEVEVAIGDLGCLRTRIAASTHRESLELRQKANQ